MRYVDGDDTVLAARGMAESRGAIEVLRTRTHLLTGRDRALLEMYLEHGNSLRQIGRVMGVTAMTVGRRIRRILQRLRDNTYEICSGNHDDFNGRELAVIKDYFVGGFSERSISRYRGVTLYRVKTTIQKARRYAATRRRENS